MPPAPWGVSPCQYRTYARPPVPAHVPRPGLYYACSTARIGLAYRYQPCFWLNIQQFTRLFTSSHFDSPCLQPLNTHCSSSCTCHRRRLPSVIPAGALPELTNDKKYRLLSDNRLLASRLSMRISFMRTLMPPFLLGYLLKCPLSRSKAVGVTLNWRCSWPGWYNLIIPPASP